MTAQDASLDDIAGAISALATKMDERFGSLEAWVGRLKAGQENTNRRLGNLERTTSQRLGNLEVIQRNIERRLGNTEALLNDVKELYALTGS